jgi:chromatin remodeling complex protein RSC6
MEWYPDRRDCFRSIGIVRSQQRQEGDPWLLQRKLQRSPPRNPPRKPRRKNPRRTPSASLAAVVGNSPMPRTEVTKKIWDYIKKNKLQDSINRRLINADEKLKAVFGGKGKVSMFEMTKLVSNHLK